MRPQVTFINVKKLPIGTLGECHHTAHLNLLHPGRNRKPPLEIFPSTMVPVPPRQIHFIRRKSFAELHGILISVKVHGWTVLEMRKIRMFIAEGPRYPCRFIVSEGIHPTVSKRGYRCRRCYNQRDCETNTCP
jgi:hypothetical protein